MIEELLIAAEAAKVTEVVLVEGRVDFQVVGQWLTVKAARVAGNARRSCSCAGLRVGMWWRSGDPDASGRAQRCVVGAPSPPQGRGRSAVRPEYQAMRNTEAWDKPWRKMNGC